jgi:hypothetical protein
MVAILLSPSESEAEHAAQHEQARRWFGNYAL